VGTSRDDEDGLSDSDPDPSSDDNGYSSDDGQGRPLWSDLDEQRLLAYKKEGKSWEWIFGKFHGRTRPTICTRWRMSERDLILLSTSRNAEAGMVEETRVQREDRSEWVDSWHDFKHHGAGGGVGVDKGRSL